MLAMTQQSPVSVDVSTGEPPLKARRTRQEKYGAIVFSVLFSRDIFQTIASCQKGMCFDFRLFMWVEPPTLQRKKNKRVELRGSNDFDEKIEIAYFTFSPWLAQVGFDRLPKLFTWMPHLGLVLVVISVTYSNIKLLDHLHRTFGLRNLCDNLIDVVAYKRNMKMFKALLDRGYIGSTFEALNFAVEHGNRDMVLTLLQFRQHDTFHNLSVLTACQNGHLEMIEHIALMEVSHLSNDACLIAAVESSRLELVEYIHRLGAPLSMQLVDTAASNGCIEILRWLIDKHGMEAENCRAMDLAAANGHIDALIFLNARKFSCSTKAMDGAAQNGHLEIINWLQMYRTEGCTVNAMNLAASNNHFDVVKWLHANRNEGCNRNAMDLAAEFGHLDMVKCLHENTNGGCTTRAVDRAVQNNHVEVAMWLLHNRPEGCSKRVVERAVASGNVHMLNWLYKRIPIQVEFEAPLLVAAKKGHVEVLIWLYNVLGEEDELYPSHPIVEAALAGQIKVIRWYLDSGLGGCRACAHRAAVEKNYPIMAKLLEAKAAQAKPCTLCAYPVDSVDDYDDDIVVSDSDADIDDYGDYD
ncbi:hypothetical protein LEN26_009108 [Aphanomyces euteiches]|nr:hypothetical protein LEN26_009108 [Aphanomyces euteiches]